ncbi:DUF4437 domain-containing protein [Bradyrhizobium sp.]|uniref:DUF4437 domain-containing protein n=1 Tax=Bradyrhizobium sp. TaxID=376 RepID=UPI00272422EB|nr:DUF4437 domain-containing protein [Bradyrhizobium sp.]MDO9294580.1 DUF4437 domain-containing protein [Bradyrhizobium sp.]
MQLRSKLASATILFALAMACTVTGNAADTKPGASVSTPAAKIAFGGTGIKTGAGELNAGPAYGNLGEGKHGTFIRMPAGYVSPLHTHTAEYFGVVISGIGVNAQAGVEEVALPTGSYWFQRGKEDHVTKCISSTDCLFFIYQPGKFDYLLAR